MGQDDDTTKIGSATIRWGAGVPTDKREALLAKMQAIRPAKPRKTGADHERARAAAQEHGTRILQAPSEPPPESARIMVRVYYRSMGDEVLAFDAGPMTPGAADRLERSCEACHGGMALGTQRYRLGGETPVSNARLVILPSQRTESAVESDAPALALDAAEVVEPQPEPATTLNSLTRAELTALGDRNSRAVPYAPHLTSALARLGAPATTRSYYADAMARRAARRAA